MQREVLGVRWCIHRVMMLAGAVLLAVGLLMLLSCGDNTRLCPDAAVDAAPDASVKDWRWAFSVYAGAWCEWSQRCDPGTFAAEYGTVERCTADNTALCDSYFGLAQCETLYPTDRYILIAQCRTDEVALACDAYPEAASCDQALIP